MLARRMRGARATKGDVPYLRQRARRLISAGIDVVKISHGLGHTHPTVTFRTYAHLFERVDTTAASAIEIALTQDAGRGTVGER
jgi:integrase